MRLNANSNENLILHNDLETKSRRYWLSFITSTSLIALFMSLNSIVFVLYPLFLYNVFSLSLDSASLAFIAIAAGDFSGRFMVGNTKVKKNDPQTQKRLTVLAIVFAVFVLVIVMIKDWQFAGLVMLSFLLGFCRGLMLVAYAVTHGEYFNYKTNPLAFALASMIVAATFVLLGPVLGIFRKWL